MACAWCVCVWCGVCEIEREREKVCVCVCVCGCFDEGIENFSLDQAWKNCTSLKRRSFAKTKKKLSPTVVFEIFLMSNENLANCVDADIFGKY